MDVDASATGVTIRAHDEHGNEIAMSLEGASITQLLTSDDWLV